MSYAPWQSRDEFNASQQSAPGAQPWEQLRAEHDSMATRHPIHSQFVSLSAPPGHFPQQAHQNPRYFFSQHTQSGARPRYTPR